jgi:hypothetical protein
MRHAWGHWHGPHPSQQRHQGGYKCPRAACSHDHSHAHLLSAQVTDALLISAFSKYSSFNKAKVVRFPHNNKTKGYGFVSLSDNEEGAKVLREMQGKYIGVYLAGLRRCAFGSNGGLAPDARRAGQGRGAPFRQWPRG